MISIIIPVYKNYEMFLENLENNKKFFKDCEVIVMNDYPGEKIAGRVKKIIPKALVADNIINLGFGGNVNKGVKMAKGEFIFLVNSDVILKDDSFKDAVRKFNEDQEIFALSFAQYEADGKLVGANRGYFKDGLIYHNRQLNTDNLKPVYNFWAEGGSAIFRRNLFLDLGSFDPLYNPFYWEDIDLSYRAWKSGFKIYYYPLVKVQHYHESTIGKFFSKKSVLKIVYRNQFIFNWKNLTDSNLLIKHVIYLPILIIRSLINRNWTLLHGLLLALIRLPKVLTSRNKTIRLFIKSDREILSQFK